jgi:hypothetical protein
MANRSKNFVLVLSALFLTSLVTLPSIVLADSELTWNFQLEPGVYLASYVQLQKGDIFEGNLTVTDLIPYQVTNPLAIALNYSGIHTFGVEIYAHPSGTKQRIFDFNPSADVQYFFNYTADYSGSYEIVFFCGRNNFGPDAKIPKVNFNYNVIEATPLKLQILSPSNQTYVESNLSLNITINRAVNAMSYSLDGKANITLNGNTTLTEVSDGMHQITVYSNDSFGYADRQTVFFTVAEEPFPVIYVAISVVTVVAVVGIGLLVYFKKRKGGKGS